MSGALLIVCIFTVFFACNLTMPGLGFGPKIFFAIVGGIVATVVLNAHAVSDENAGSADSEEDSRYDEAVSHRMLDSQTAVVTSRKGRTFIVARTSSGEMGFQEVDKRGNKIGILVQSNPKGLRMGKTIEEDLANRLKFKMRD